MTKKVVFTVVLIFIAVVLAGCGGGSEAGADGFPEAEGLKNDFSLSDGAETIPAENPTAETLAPPPASPTNFVDNGPSQGATGTVIGVKYTIAQKDNLFRIGQRFNCDDDVLAQNNGIADKAKINAGDVIVISCN